MLSPTFMFICSYLGSYNGSINYTKCINKFAFASDMVSIHQFVLFVFLKLFKLISRNFKQNHDIFWNVFKLYIGSVFKKEHGISNSFTIWSTSILLSRTLSNKVLFLTIFLFFDEKFAYAIFFNSSWKSIPS